MVDVSSFRHKRIIVLLHNPDAFHDEEMRRRVDTQASPLANIYLVQFERKYMLETQFDQYKSTKWTCGAGNYSYDHECVYKKLEDLSKMRTCTSPW